MKPTKLLATMALLLPAMAHGQGWYAGLDVGAARSDAKIDEYAFLRGTTDSASGSTTGFRWEDFGLTLGGVFGVYDPGESSVTSFGVSYRW